MKRVLLAASVAVVGLTGCQKFFREGNQDAAGNSDAHRDSASAAANIIFLTDQVFTGNLNGRAGADDKCRVAAIQGGLTGTFVAVLGDTGAAADKLALERISTARGWVLPDGKPVMEIAADLTSGRQWYPISQDQFRNQLGANALYWSGSQDAGGISHDCNRWLDTDTPDLTGDVGHGQIAGGLSIYGQGCTKSARLLCAAIDLNASITPPKGTGKHIFVSTIPFGPNAIGRDKADEICATEAGAAQLPGTYLAFLGTSTSTPIMRFNGLDVYQRVDGQPLGFLSAAPASFINRSATNTVVNSQVWAYGPGTLSATNCVDWTSTMEYGGLGRSNTAGSGAYVDLFKDFSFCDVSFPVYCVEK